MGLQIPYDIKLNHAVGLCCRDDGEESDIDILIVSPIAGKTKPEIYKIALSSSLKNMKLYIQD